jgi:hypothetical protein
MCVGEGVACSLCNILPKLDLLAATSPKSGTSIVVDGVLDALRVATAFKPSRFLKIDKEA